MVKAEFRDRLRVARALDYSNDVAVVALLPYLRQAIADLTQRVFGSPLLMPALQRGAVTFSMVGA